MKKSSDRCVGSMLNFVILEDRSVPAIFVPTTFLDLDTAGVNLTTGMLPSGEITLRSAILAANATAGADSIQLTPGTYRLTLTGDEENSGVTGDLDISDDLAIEASDSVLDASGLGDRVLDIVSGVNVTINFATIQGGSHQPLSGDASGGGIQNRGSLTLNNVIIQNNQAIGPSFNNNNGIGAGSAFGGGIASFGDLVVNGGEIRNNSAIAGDDLTDGFAGSASGGGLFQSGNGLAQFTSVRLTGNTAKAGAATFNVETGTAGSAVGGGAFVDNFGPVTFDRVRIDNNQAIGGAGTLSARGGTAQGGGLDVSSFLTTIRNSTIDSNLARGGSGSSVAESGLGGLALGGGASVNISFGRANVVNSTISGNRTIGGDGIGDQDSSGGTAIGGGVYIFNFNSTSGTSFIAQTTITENESIGGDSPNVGISSGGGLYYRTFIPELVLTSTIVAGNRAGADPDLIIELVETVGKFSSGGSNLIGISNGDLGFVDGVNNDQVGTLTNPIDARLTPLGLFGGDNIAPVHALGIGSPARDRGDGGTLITDQRGAGFDRVVNGQADVGAFEVQFPESIEQSIAGVVVTGAPFTISATVTDSRFPPTGNVEFFIDGNSIGTAPLDSFGVATITTTVVSSGDFTVRVSYLGDAAYISRDTNPSTFTAVDPTPTTTSVIVLPDPIFVTNSVTFIASVASTSTETPTGTIQFVVDGNTFGSPIALDTSATATLTVPGGLAVGDHTVVSIYSGDFNFASSSSQVVPFSVAPLPTTSSVVVTPDVIVVTDAVTFVTSVTSSFDGTPSGTIQFFVDGNAFGSPIPLDSSATATLTAPSGFSIGSHSVFSVYTGDAIYSASQSESVSFEVNPATTQTSVLASPNPVFATDPIFLDAQVLGSISQTPTGTVTFFLGDQPIGTVSLDEFGRASLIVPGGLGVGTGTYPIFASYSGDENFTGSTSSTIVLSVIAVPTVATLTAMPNVVTQGSVVTLTANVVFGDTTNPGQVRAGINPAILEGSVNFFNGSTLLGSAPINVGAATLLVSDLPVGSNTISAVFVPGNSNLDPSSASIVVTVNPLETTTHQIFAASSGYGIITTVKVYDADGNELTQFQPYGPNYWCGAVVATGDVNGDGAEDVLVAPSLSGGPHVKIYDGVTFALIAEFFAYDPNFRGGVSIAAGDLDGDGVAEIITGAGPGGGPQVNVYSFASDGVQLRKSFFAYDASFRGGITVAVSGGLLATGPGFTGGPHVKIFSGIDANLVASYFAFDPNSRNGVNVALSFDGTRIVLTAGTDAGRQPIVQTFDALNGNLLDSQLVYEPGFLGGVTVTNVRTLQGESRTVFGTGLGGGPRIRIFGPEDVSLFDFFAFGEDFRGGVFVG